MSIINYLSLCFYGLLTLTLDAPDFHNSEKISWKEFKLSGLAQGTTYHITYFARKSMITQDQVDSILDKIDSSLSIYKSYSLINRFNRSTRGSDIDAHLEKVILKSLEISRRTNGLSDITIYPLVNAWGFGPDTTTSYPDSVRVKALLKCVGIEKIQLQNDSLLKDSPCVQIDVNGIAQGYTVDVIAGFLERRNIANYLVELGGELRVRGRKQPGSMSFQIGVEAPDEDEADERVIQKILKLDHGAVTTSGNFNKYHSSGGKIFSHLIDPKTGYSFQNELISVTVMADEAITADGYDNALMGMGLRQALEFRQTHPDLEVYFIYRKEDGTIADTATAGFNRFFNSAAP